MAGGWRNSLARGVDGARVGVLMAADHLLQRILASVIRIDEHLHELLQQKTEPRATRADLKKVEVKIMSAISEFAAKQRAFNDRQGVAIDAAVASVAGLSGDIQALNDKITELQDSVGTVSPEDQGLIDELETQGEAVASKVEAVANALSALDAQTPPSVPAS